MKPANPRIGPNLMEKVLSITGRIEDRKRRHEVNRFRNVLRTVQRTVRCSSCRLKCAMCGAHVEMPGSSSREAPEHARDVHLCQGCRAEFRDYLQFVHDRRASGLFWHNREWIRMWSAWMEFQRAIGDFKNTTEFKRLLEELGD